MAYVVAEAEKFYEIFVLATDVYDLLGEVLADLG